MELYFSMIPGSDPENRGGGVTKLENCISLVFDCPW